jgi:hypothetical protein
MRKSGGSALSEEDLRGLATLRQRHLDEGARVTDPAEQAYHELMAEICMPLHRVLLRFDDDIDSALSVIQGLHQALVANVLYLCDSTNEMDIDDLLALMSAKTREYVVAAREQWKKGGPPDGRERSE